MFCAYTRPRYQGALTGPLVLWLGLYPVWTRYPKDSHTIWAAGRSLIAMMKLKIEFAKNMCLSTIRSTEICLN